MHLLKKDIPFLWDDQAQWSFEVLKSALTSTPILSPPDYCRNFLLYLAVVEYTMGMVLVKEGDDTKDTFMWIQMNLIISTSYENCSKVNTMLNPSFRVGCQVIKISFNNFIYVMKSIWHGLLECGSNIFKTKRNFPICKSPPRTDEGSFMLIFRFYLNLVVFEETIHKGKLFIPSTIIDNLINEGCGIIFLWISQVQVMKICANFNATFLFGNSNGIWNPFS